MSLNWLIYKRTNTGDFLGINLDQTVGIREKNLDPPKGLL